MEVMTIIQDLLFSIIYLLVLIISLSFRRMDKSEEKCRELLKYKEDKCGDYMKIMLNMNSENEKSVEPDNKSKSYIEMQKH